MTIRFQVELPYISGLPEDVSVNTFHSPITTIDGTIMGLVTVALGTFYTSVAGQLSPVLEGDMRIKVYDMADAEPRTPLFDGVVLNQFSTSGTPMPEEVAICLSHRAAYDSGAPPARRRGRIYLGPLDAVTLATIADNRTRVAPLELETLLDAWEQLHIDMIAAGAPLGVYSRADNVCRPVEAVFVDDSFDTQRRRGVVAQYRETRILA